jgi:dual specificity phosphatase 12
MRFPFLFKYLKLQQLRDRPSEELSVHLPAVYEFIDNARDSGGRVLVHCFKGQSRSAAIVCAYLVDRLGMSLEEALSIVRSARPIAIPNSGFMRQLRALEEAASRRREVVVQDP